MCLVRVCRIAPNPEGSEEPLSGILGKSGCKPLSGHSGSHSYRLYIHYKERELMHWKLQNLWSCGTQHSHESHKSIQPSFLNYMFLFLPEPFHRWRKHGTRFHNWLSMHFRLLKLFWVKRIVGEFLDVSKYMRSNSRAYLLRERLNFHKSKHQIDLEVRDVLPLGCYSWYSSLRSQHCWARRVVGNEHGWKRCNTPWTKISAYSLLCFRPHPRCSLFLWSCPPGHNSPVLWLEGVGAGVK